MSNDSMSRKRKEKAGSRIKPEEPKGIKKTEGLERPPKKEKEREKRKEFADGGRRNGSGALPLDIESR